MSTFDEDQQYRLRPATSTKHVADSAVIDAPLIPVWRIVRDFGAGARWLPGVVATEIEDGHDPTTIGAVRRMTLADGGSSREQLVGLSDLRHVVELAVVETAVPVSGYTATWRLEPVGDGDRTWMSWSAEFEAREDGFDALADHLITQVFRPAFARLRDVAAA